MRAKVDQYAEQMAETVQESVHSASALKVMQRIERLEGDLHDPEGARDAAAAIKQNVLDHLAEYLHIFEQRLIAAGARVHWARDAAEARQTVIDICKATGVRSIIKSKSMLSEEIELNQALEHAGYEVVETDLGEYIVQIDGDRPSHIVTPVIHKSKAEISRLFERMGLGPYTESAEELTMQARRHLREKFRAADCGITGVNFAVAESGRVVICTNEGNGRYTASAPPVHIALMGIEKLIPNDQSLAPFLKLLARSATGQRLTVYTQFIRAPRATGELDGPREMHVVIVDNGRSAILADPECHEVLRCIRCGACLNVCPVYRQTSGHGYFSVYGGPIGAVLSPLLEAGRRQPAPASCFAHPGTPSARPSTPVPDAPRGTPVPHPTDLIAPEFAELPKASSLCAACADVCPVRIPLPEMLLTLRARAVRHGFAKLSGAPDFRPFAAVATRPSAWRATVAATRLPGARIATKFPIASLRAWRRSRDLPPFPKTGFRQWWRKREKQK